MSSVFDSTSFGAQTFTTDTPTANGTPTADPSTTLRNTTAAVRVSFTWFGTRKALTNEQRDQVAERFDAAGEFISAGKKLVNTKHEKFKAVTAIRTQIIKHWKDNSLPFPEPGIRLIRRERVDSFQEQMAAFRDDLMSAVDDLERHFEEIREEARARLGTLYNPADYPTTLQGLFSVSWDFPNVEPPDYLMRLRPDVYEAERRRVAQQFDDAVRLAEQAFTEQFAELVNSICERLERNEDGSPKKFQDSTVNNLMDFFERFRTLNVHSNPELDRLVEQARAAVSGATPRGLRTREDLRQTVTARLSEVGRTLETMMTERPRRRIIRPTQTPTPTQE